MLPQTAPRLALKLCPYIAELYQYSIVNTKGTKEKQKIAQKLRAASQRNAKVSVALCSTSGFEVASATVRQCECSKHTFDVVPIAVAKLI